jgi:starch phosphorylase
VGRDNIFIFGLTADEVSALKPQYNPWVYYHGNNDLRRTLDMIRDGAFSPYNRGLFRPIYDSLLQGGDHYLLLADYASYIEAQQRVEQTYRNPAEWTRKSILNVANMGKFSSDRTIQQYAEEIWGVTGNYKVR